MRFANIDLDSYGAYNNRDKLFFNIGDQYQALAINHIFECMGVEQKDIVPVRFDQLADYDGEEVVLPLNMVFTLTNKISPKITPVFLGVSILNKDLSPEMRDLLRNHSPIGCRDEKTYTLLKGYNISSYISGCVTITFPKRKIDTGRQTKIYFIDAPKALLPYVPTELRQNAEAYSNVGYGVIDEYTNGIPLSEFAWKRLEELRDTAALVITSRLHVASPCMALGIPVICATETYTATFSWLDKYIPVYTKENYKDINWNPPVLDIEDTKKKLINLWDNTLDYIAYSKNAQNYLTQHYLNRNTIPLEKYHNPLEQMKEFILSKWNQDQCVEYAIWGAGEVAHDLNLFLASNYENANLIAVFDRYKRGVFYDKEIELPSGIAKHPHLFVFVTAVRAYFDAKAYFNETNKDLSEVYFVHAENRYENAITLSDLS